MHLQSKPAGSLQGETHPKDWLDSSISLRRPAPGQYHLVVANIAQGCTVHQDLLFSSWRAEHPQVSPSHFSRGSRSQVTSVLLWPFLGGTPRSPAGHSVGRKRGVGPGCIPCPSLLWHISALEGREWGLPQAPGREGDRREHKTAVNTVAIALRW